MNQAVIRVWVSKGGGSLRGKGGERARECMDISKINVFGMSK